MKDIDSAESYDQYSLIKIVGLWLLASAPMGLLAWVAFPALRDRVDMQPVLLLWVLMIGGLLWQVALSLIILYRETGTLKLGAMRQRTWRQQTRDRETGQPRGKLWFWIVPAILLTAAFEFAISPLITIAWTTVLPFFAEPPGYDLQLLMLTPDQWAPGIS